MVEELTNTKQKTETTTIGIDMEIRDKAKIHVINYKNKYETLTDFINKAVVNQIEDDEHDTDTDSIN